jgi:hypothetical protein
VENEAKMRSDSEIKGKLVELLQLEGEQRSQQIQALDKNELNALKTRLVEHHSTRGMVAALYWVLGYEFKDIIENFVDPSVSVHEKARAED